MIPFPTDIERVAFAGDWHGNTKWARNTISECANRGAQAIVQLGDFGYNFADEYLDVLSAKARQWGVPVMFVDGNHENFDWLNAQPVDDDGVRRLRDYVWHLPRGFRWEWSGVRFLALGGAPSIDREWRTPGVSWWHQEWISDADFKNAVAGGTTDVIVSHDCPAGVMIPYPSNEWPAPDMMRAAEARMRMRDAVDEIKPAFIWHGHYHVHYRGTFAYDYAPGEIPVPAECQVTGLGCDGYSMPYHIDVVDLRALLVDESW